MSPQTPELAPPLSSSLPAVAEPHRRAAADLSFRFCLAYFSLYIFFTQMLGGLFLLPVGELPEFGTIFPMRNLVSAVARPIFRIESALVITGSGSGDKIYDWVHNCCLLGLALRATRTLALPGPSSGLPRKS